MRARLNAAEKRLKRAGMKNTRAFISASASWHDNGRVTPTALVRAKKQLASDGYPRFLVRNYSRNAARDIADSSFRPKSRSSRPCRQRSRQTNSMTRSAVTHKREIKPYVTNKCAINHCRRESISSRTI